MKTKDVKITGLEIYEAVYDSAREEYIPGDFDGQVEDIKQYADGVWNITLSTAEAQRIAQAYADLSAANEKDGQWSHNYHMATDPLEEMEFVGWTEVYED